MAAFPMLDAFDVASAPLGAPSVELLEGLARGPATRHARFLNTLSLLEHLGSYKIMATQDRLALDRATLRHLADETRHAFFFKRQAERVAHQALSYGADDVLAATAALRYFQRLEVTVRRQLRVSGRSHPRAIYLYTSLLIELRAIWFYRRYQEALMAAGQPLSLETLLAEESGHLGEMERRLEAVAAFDAELARELIATECRLYARLLAHLVAAAQRHAEEPTP